MFQNDDFVEVSVEGTDQTQFVPKAWLGHPVLGKGFAALTTGQEVGAKADRVTDIVDAVGTDKAKAQAALELEQSSDAPRSSLVKKLQAVIDAPAPDSTDASGAGETDSADGQKES